VFDAVIESDRARKEASAQFVRRLQREGTALVYSSLLFLEAPQCWRRFFRRGELKHNDPEIPDDRLEAFKRANTLLEEFLDAFDCQEVTITKSLMNAAARIVAIYDVRAHEALSSSASRRLARLAHRLI
jgi:hypothetical protein